MIKMLTNEYREGGSAVKVIVVTFLSIPIFKYRAVTTLYFNSSEAC